MGFPAETGMESWTPVSAVRMCAWDIVRSLGVVDVVSRLGRDVHEKRLEVRAHVGVGILPDDQRG